MVTYKVLAPGFYGKGKSARLYDPNGKRPFLKREEPFEKGKTPKWLELVKEVDKPKAASHSVDTEALKVIMKKMIKEEDNLGTDGIPNVAPLAKKAGVKVTKKLRDELLVEIKAEEQIQIEKDEMTFIESPGAEKKGSKVTTL